MKLYITDIEKALEAKKIDDRYKKIINILLEAINDWPNPISSLDDYESEVEKFIKNSTTTQKGIEEALKKIDFSKNAWQAESLYQLINVFQFYKNDTLKKIIDDLKINLKNLP